MNALKENMNVPQHIAIIMDGNGRWAKQHNKSRIEGHKKGAQQIKKVLDGARKFGVKYITLYAFSSENWNRPKVEVSALMHLLEKSIKANEKDFIKNEVRFETIGDISALPSYCQKAIAKIKKSTQHFNKQTLILALNYGSRDEITRVVKKLITSAENNEISSKDITWECIQQNLDTAHIPDPDLIIRTSGEKRLSNYLMLQAAYAEFYFTDILWPDFDEQHLHDAIQEYANRERRYGLTSEQIQKQC
ncbi:MAG: isoprenyl transferase [Verrucomicrobiaceae bacterium]|nr:isoprenyl transferase [Verrucomicrobiaceae bacterium]